MKADIFISFLLFRSKHLGLTAKYYITGHCSYSRQYHKLDYKISELKKAGWKVLIITVLEALAAFVIVFCLCFFAFRLSVAFSLVLGALSSATAPASTLMTVKQTKAKGHYVNTLFYYQMHY